MKFGEWAAVLFILGSSLAATGVAPSQKELADMYEKAARELGARHYSAALKELTAIDALQPGQAAVQNFRGVVLTQKGDYAGAEAALHAALEIDPHLLPASFNLANVPFLKKDWAQARKGFEALLESLPDEMREEVAPIVQYKILLTHLLENKEEKVGPLLSALQGWTESPAFAYAEAAIAFHRKKREAGQGWITAAGKDYPAQSNLLFLESFYELDWLPRPAGQPRAIAEFISPAERSARTQAEALANFEAAKRALQARDFDQALKLLDQLKGGAVQPGDVANLRAAILLEQKKFPEAEKALGKVAAANPASWETKYLLAKIALRKKNYAEGRAQLEALLKAPPPDLEHKNVQLIKYEIFLSLLREGQESAAQKAMEEFKFKDDTPALYYAQAAWAFAHDNQKQATEWVTSAGKLFSPSLNSAFANALSDLGWLGAPAAGTAGAEETPASAVAETTPALPAASAPSPSAAASTPVAVVAKNSATPTPAGLPETVEATPALPAASIPAPTPAKPSPAAVVEKSSIAPTATPPPEIAAATASPPPVTTPAPTPAKSMPAAVVAEHSAAPTATVAPEIAQVTPSPPAASAPSLTPAKPSPAAVVAENLATPTPASPPEIAVAKPTPPPISAPAPTPARSAPVAVVAKNATTPTPAAPPPETPVAATQTTPASESAPAPAVSEKEEAPAQVSEKSPGRTSRKRSRRRAKSSRATSEEEPAATSKADGEAAAPVTAPAKPAAAPRPAPKQRPSFLQRLARTLLNGDVGVGGAAEDAAGSHE